jgi:hypothetical protein
MRDGLQNVDSMYFISYLSADDEEGAVPSRGRRPPDGAKNPANFWSNHSEIRSAR